MVDHGARGHARWAASSTARNWACSGALTLAETVITPERESRAAAWGTACHQVAEKCLSKCNDAAHYIGAIEKTKQHEFEVDEEMADCAQQYVDYINAASAKSDWLKIEQRFTFKSLNPPYESGGTADAVLYSSAAKLIEIVDLKGGRGVIVEVIGNAQLRSYALGAMLANPHLDVERVKVTIVQPRAAHKDGRIRSETFHVIDLMEWTADLLAAMHRTREAQDMFNATPRAAWDAKYLNAGEHCQFCPARGFCPALAQRALDAAGVWFNNEDQPQMSNAPDSMSPEELSKKLDLLDLIGDWINAVRAHAQQLAEGGVEIPNYQLTETIGHRKFIDENAVRELLFVRADLTDDDMYSKKFKSPAQIEKTLGTKRLRTVEKDLGALIVRPVTGTNLVRSTKTTRPAVPPAVNKYFSKI